MKSRIILSIQLHSLSTDELRRLLSDWLNSNTSHFIVTPNPEFLLLAQDDQEFSAILNRANLSLPDGIGLKFAAWFNNFNLRRHTGVDTTDLLAELCAETNKKLILFGGQKQNSETAAEKLRQKFLTLDVEVLDPGIISESGEINEAIIEKIIRISPSVLAVALGQGKQEKFIDRYLHRFQSVKIAIGIGGALDMISGNLPRAPKIVRLLGLEWLWRLILEPSRWPRIFRAVIVFPVAVMLDQIFTKIEK